MINNRFWYRRRPWRQSNSNFSFESQTNWLFCSTCLWQLYVGLLPNADFRPQFISTNARETLARCVFLSINTSGQVEKAAPSAWMIRSVWIRHSCKMVLHAGGSAHARGINPPVVRDNLGTRCANLLHTQRAPQATSSFPALHKSPRWAKLQVCAVQCLMLLQSFAAFCCYCKTRYWALQKCWAAEVDLPWNFSWVCTADTQQFTFCGAYGQDPVLFQNSVFPAVWRNLAPACL